MSTKPKFVTKCGVLFIGAVATAAIGAGTASADVIEISADGVVHASTNATVREVGASGTNTLRGVDRLSVFSGLAGSKVSTSKVYVPGGTACTNAPALNYTSVVFRGCDQE